MSSPLRFFTSLRPAAGESLPATGGCLASGCLHGLASLVIMALGTAFLGREGSLVVLPFWLFLGLAQWFYLAPLAIGLSRLGRTGLAKGLWIGGLLVVLLNGLYWGGLAVTSVLYGLRSREVQRYAREHPITHRDVAGTVVALDAGHIEVQTADGVVSVRLDPTTHYIRLNGPFGKTAADPSIVNVGGEVVVDAASFDGGPLYAEYVSANVPDASPSPLPGTGLPP